MRRPLDSGGDLTARRRRRRVAVAVPRPLVSRSLGCHMGSWLMPDGDACMRDQVNVQPKTIAFFSFKLLHPPPSIPADTVVEGGRGGWTDEAMTQ